MLPPRSQRFTHAYRKDTIVNGKPTEKKLSAQEAFSDPEQAIEQVLYAERHGSREELKLVRLGYRQYQQKRFRSK